MNKQAAITRIVALVQRYATLTNGHTASGLIPVSQTTGKLYEAYVLSRVVENLHTLEGLEVRLAGNAVALKSSPGPINRTYPYFQLLRTGCPTPVAELWTDTEFMTLSWQMRGKRTPLTRGDFHELDILITSPAIPNRSRPLNDQVWFGAECKHRAYSKELLRGILGVRRELSLLQKPRVSSFAVWPQPTVPAVPSSCLAVYSSDPAVLCYAQPGQTFGIDFLHDPV